MWGTRAAYYPERLALPVAEGRPAVDVDVADLPGSVGANDTLHGLDRAHVRCLLLVRVERQVVEDRMVRRGLQIEPGRDERAGLGHSAKNLRRGLRHVDATSQSCAGARMQARTGLSKGAVGKEAAARARPRTRAAAHCCSWKHKNSHAECRSPFSMPKATTGLKIFLTIPAPAAIFSEFTSPIISSSHTRMTASRNLGATPAFEVRNVLSSVSSAIMRGPAAALYAMRVAATECPTDRPGSAPPAE